VTPYAILLVRPLDTDATIRARFHLLSKDQHPDRWNAGGVPGPNWYVLVGAYAAIKIQALRDVWISRQRGLSGLCKSCDGTGVVGSRVGGSKIRLCTACDGEGRRR